MIRPSSILCRVSINSNQYDFDVRYVEKDSQKIKGSVLSCSTTSRRQVAVASPRRTVRAVMDVGNRIRTEFDMMSMSETSNHYEFDNAMSNRTLRKSRKPFCRCIFQHDAGGSSVAKTKSA